MKGHSRCRAWFRAGALACLLGLGSCSTLIEYSDALVDNSTGRSNFVTKPASFVGVLGFVAGIPFDVVGLPVSYVVYQSQKSGEEEGVDPLSTLLFPSFVLWRAGVLIIGAPLDLLEYAFYRAWTRDPSDADEGKRRDLERELDEQEKREREKRQVDGANPGGQGLALTGEPSPGLRPAF